MFEERCSVNCQMTSTRKKSRAMGLEPPESRRAQPRRSITARAAATPVAKHACRR